MKMKLKIKIKSKHFKKPVQERDSNYPVLRRAA
jgi:hypothetical protein